MKESTNIVDSNRVDIIGSISIFINEYEFTTLTPAGIKNRGIYLRKKALKV